MEPLEGIEDSVSVFHLEPHAIVFDADGKQTRLRFATDTHFRRALWTPVFDGISDEVLEHLNQLALVDPQNGEFTANNVRTAFPYRSTQIPCRFFDYGFEAK